LVQKSTRFDSSPGRYNESSIIGLHLDSFCRSSLGWTFQKATFSNISATPVLVVDEAGVLRRGFALGFVNYTKGCTRLAAASDKVCQLLSHGGSLRLLPPLKLVAMI
jgi:hypothetical protein